MFRARIQSVVANAASGQISTTPFPHLVVYDALDTQLYRWLSDGFPSLGLVAAGKLVNPNAAYLLSGQGCVGGDVIWSEFMRYI
ncbi:MAG: hypothetical protein ACREYF_13490 [Gammaproteobacteria bacterium]